MLINNYTCNHLQVDVDESTLSPEEQKERKIMKLLLKIKNGTPPMRKVKQTTTVGSLSAYNFVLTLSSLRSFPLPAVCFYLDTKVQLLKEKTIPQVPYS